MVGSPNFEVRITDYDLILDSSTVGSGFKSPVSAAMVQTPRSKVRSRVAGALRNDGELEELEAILEEGHEISREMGREIGKEMGREIVREMAAQRAEQREPEVRVSGCTVLF